MQKRLLIALGLVLAIVFANVTAYVIYLTLVSKTPPPALIFFSLLVPALATAFIPIKIGQHPTKSMLRMAFSAAYPRLAIYSILIAASMFAYHALFWTGFFQIKGSAGLVLSILSLTIIFSPLISYIGVSTLSISNPGTLTRYKGLFQLISVVLFIFAAFLFSVPESFNFSQSWFLLSQTIGSKAAFLIFLAMLAECFKDRLTISIRRSYHPEYNLSQIANQEDRQRLAINIATTQGNLIGAAFAALAFLTFGSFSNNERDFPPFSTFASEIPIVVGFIILGIVARQLIEIRLKAMRFKLDALHTFYAVRPAVLFLVSIPLFTLLSSIGCESENCISGIISLSNPFDAPTTWDWFALTAVVIALVLLIAEFIQDGFFETTTKDES